jgi:hypothetical protein
MVEDVKTAVGTSLPVGEATITRVRQRRMLAACDVDPARYASAADPSLLCIDCILAIRRSKVRTPDRLIHLEQHLELKGEVKLDEKLGVRAKVEKVEQTKDGERALAVFEFFRGDGTAVAVARTATLANDPNWLRDAAAVKGDPRAGWKLLGRKLLNAGKVQSYSEETGSRLHFDPAFAVRYGLRAPVANPLMSLTWAFEAFSASGAPAMGRISARFPAALFWDDGVDVLVREKGGKITAVRCVSSAGAVVADIEVTA